MVGKFRDYSFGCHGIEERCFKLKGRSMSICARCLGASIGHILAALNFFLLAFPPVWVAAIGLAFLYSDWYMQNRMKFYHSNVMRLITGILGGYAVGLVIWTVLKILFEFVV